VEHGMENQWLNIKRAAQYMKTTRGHVNRLCRKGRIPFTRNGRIVRLKREDCDAYIEKLKR
jgi:excisionase family DNA binding protein